MYGHVCKQTLLDVCSMICKQTITGCVACSKQLLGVCICKQTITGCM